MAAKEEEEELLLHLFDLYWFKHQILINQKPFSPNPFQELTNEEEEEDESPKSDKPSSLHVIRPLSDQSLSSKDTNYGGTESPNSVLAHSKIDSILSGGEPDEFPDEKTEQQKIKKMKKKRRKRRARRLSRFNKSLSELEHEELKGFMDLGFVFSEEDKESPRLVSILPGLQRLRGGRKQGNHGVAIDGEAEQARAVSRPYLSEAWRKKEENPPLLMTMVMNWRLPSLSNEIDMKNHLRIWAHTVASVVR